jgi:hypothetical protein
MAWQSEGESPYNPSMVVVCTTASLLNYNTMHLNKRVRPENRPRIFKINGVSVPADDWYLILPEIKLRGEWLEKLGFNPGGKVCITSSKNEVVISLIK